MKHGYSGTKIYQIWCAMKQRCFYPKHNRFKNYGGRGITTCKEWLNFQNFYDDMHKSYQAHCEKYGGQNTTINRENTNDNYTKQNCKWSTQWEQQQNRTNNHLITYKGLTKPITEWARIKGFKRGIIEGRLKRGWSIENILTLSRYTIIKKRKLTEQHKSRIKKSMLEYFNRIKV